jgi:cytochrome c oxidase assembly factor CtaG
LFDAALNNDFLHVFQHFCYFSAGFNVWMALFGPLPKPAWFGNAAKLIFIAGMWAADMILGNIFVFSSSAFYDEYLSADNMWGLSPTADQSVAGAVMMAVDTVIAFVLLAWLFFKAASEGEKSQELLDLADEHGFEMTSERSDRAAAAGTADLLRERIVSGLDKPEN